jgi:AraC-like DNA-binding protein
MLMGFYNWVERRNPMDWLERMNRAMDYIELNLAGEIELSEVARRACCSSHQFQRMFSFITNVTLAEYIRRRKLTLAALEMQNNEAIRVIDIAIKYVKVVMHQARRHNSGNNPTSMEMLRDLLLTPVACRVL